MAQARDTRATARLASRLQAAGVGVDVIVPARDEAATIGEVVRRLDTALRRDHAVIDDLLVVDAGSSDDTARQASAAGARVVHQAEVLPTFGDRVGKGEAMWKGLAASRNGLVVFVDGDLVDLDPTLVVALLESLLDDPARVLVHAAYDRPWRVGDLEVPDGGGRVTQLLARPTLAALWPELAHLTQPLTGEYAARRSALLEVPFVTGYGVELGRLRDRAARHGPHALHEGHGGTGYHTHPPLPALARRASELLQVALERAERQGRLQRTGPNVPNAPHPGPAGRGMLRAQPAPSVVDERPPLSEVAGPPTG
ncbi:MAG: glucosyl-3-phosphoglycerate synthase [Nitriliruptoraceae bacterium]|nr:glucosyl-3-phosphoglycerate synthase [Nitriliruptoraceae bacterium]